MKIVIKLFIIVMVCANCQSQEKNENQLTKKIENYLSQLQDNGFSGSVLVAYKGDIISSRGYGLGNRESKMSNSSQTVFDIGSITKQFTAAAILKLEMQGKLSVNDKIGNYFSNVPADKQKITLHQLLTHSSGLKPSLGGDYEKISSNDFISKVFNQDLLFRPSSKYEYSNVGYTLLALIIEKVSNTTYENYLYQNLWKPSNMEQTGYLRPEFQSGDIAVGYRKSGAWGKPNDKWNDNVSWHLKGNGGILSTIEDMYKWHQALLSADILSKDAKEKYYKPYIKEGEDAPSFYGYGWAIYPTPRDTYLITHNGGNNIFFADFWRYLTEEITIIMMSNSYQPEQEIINMNIAGLILTPHYEPVTNVEEDDTVSSGNQATIDNILDKFINTIQSEDKSNWETFLKDYATPEFLGMAPMKMHLSMFQKFHEKAKGKKVIDILMEDGEAIIKFDGGGKLIVNIDQYKENKFGIAGVMAN